MSFFFFGMIWVAWYVVSAGTFLFTYSFNIPPHRWMGLTYFALSFRLSYTRVRLTVLMVSLVAYRYIYTHTPVLKDRRDRKSVV